jgi:hypothetical protein
MLVKLLIVAEVEVPDGAPEPESAALLRLEALQDSADGVTFWEPALGRTVHYGDSKSVEVFY